MSLTGDMVLPVFLGCPVALPDLIGWWERNHGVCQHCWGPVLSYWVATNLSQL